MLSRLTLFLEVGKQKKYKISQSQDVKSKTKNIPPNIFQEDISDFKYEYCTESGIDNNVKKPKTSDKKSRIRETSNLSTDADRRTDIILENLRDLSRKKI